MRDSPQDLKFMRLALAQARLAGKRGEVPIGAVLVRDGQVLTRAFNLRETRRSPSGHAELLAIEKAAKKLKAWRLADTTLYVTLEPCLMCWGVIVLARVPRVVFGAMDPKAGVCGSLLSLHEDKRFNHHPKVAGRILEEECGAVLTEFFSNLRAKKKKAKGSTSR